MKREDIVYIPDFYSDHLDHTEPILHYHLSYYTKMMNDIRDESWQEGLEMRIDGRESPPYPGDDVFARIIEGELDPLEHGMLPHIRGWEWCLWLVPKRWIKDVDRNAVLVWVDGTKENIGRVDPTLVNSVFGMLPAGLLIGEETFRFTEGIWLHDQLIDRIRNTEKSEKCTNMIFEKSFAGDWYFPDVIVILEDMHSHVKRHRALREEASE